MSNKTIYIPDELNAAWETIENKSAWIADALRKRQESQGAGPDMEEIINGLRYSTAEATLVAHDHYWDGHNWDRKGRNRYLYRTANSRFFLALTTRWQGERDCIEAIDVDSAKKEYERLPEKEISYAEAFGEEPQAA